MRRFLSLLLLVLVSVTPARAAGEGVRSVVLARFVGLPADSAARGVFLEAFHEEMDAEAWPAEKRDGDEWRSEAKRTNLFRLVDAAAPDETWTLDLSIRVPPEVRVARSAKPGSRLPPPRARVSHVRSSRGLTIAATVASPRTSLGTTTAEPAIFSVYFADARRVVVPSPRLPGGGYAYPWADAGRVVARAALEALHRASGGLSADERASLVPATRMDPAGAEVVP